jgi:hypothetical protein
MGKVFGSPLGYLYAVAYAQFGNRPFKKGGPLQHCVQQTAP